MTKGTYEVAAVDEDKIDPKNGMYYIQLVDGRCLFLFVLDATWSIFKSVYKYIMFIFGTGIENPVRH